MDTHIWRWLLLLMAMPRGLDPALGDQRSPVASPRCTYTFVVPQQKFVGAVCWSGAKTAAPPRDNAGADELQALQTQLRQQEVLIKELREQVAAAGATVSEVRALCGEARDPGSQPSQLQPPQLTHGKTKGSQGDGLAQLEGQVINALAEAQRATAQYHQLDAKYHALAALVNDQSTVITKLQQRCPGGPKGQQVQDLNRTTGQVLLPPNLSPSGLGGLAGNGSNGSGRPDRELQREQSRVPGQPQRQQGVPASPLPTGPPGTPTQATGPWQDCLEAQKGRQGISGVYLVRLGQKSVPVWCEQQLEGGGWMVIQRRQDGSVNFFTNWQNYKVGFGRPDGEHWLGLENIHLLTQLRDHELLVLLEDWGGRGVHARYDAFSLEPESDHYRLRLGHYRGDAGDSLSWHNDKPFSTVDRDRDSYSGNCALYQRGGWWYHACAHSNLNGIWHLGGHYRSRYQDGVYWAEFRGGAYSLKKVAMLIRPL
ncbi:angiopoietin-related protein 6 isoform X2 [Vombatus ursinus]|uniref:Angiopoietin like 6 n=2 Tax=Vombatus ursinus TaxID=29139 RepID=A0A4X2M4I8_VOMUR|nr:angiopoietin-related protein 6 isoform X2 [Vombatus ursinus]XP_027713596.1 angiopoietin-related protein 6 isoform X2 [Vombatus ursinus]